MTKTCPNGLRRLVASQEQNENRGCRTWDPCDGGTGAYLGRTVHEAATCSASVPTAPGTPPRPGSPAPAWLPPVTSGARSLTAWGSAAEPSLPGSWLRHHTLRQCCLLGSPPPKDGHLEPGSPRRTAGLCQGAVATPNPCQAPLAPAYLGKGSAGSLGWGDGRLAPATRRPSPSPAFG